MDEGQPGLDFLGVGASLTGRAWRLRPAEAARVTELRRGLDLSEPLARALAARCDGLEAGRQFLDPRLRTLFPDPSSFRDMDAAAEVLLDALQARRRIVVFADYDVDGAASAALLIRWFRALGHEIDLYVPDRLTEGYGPSPEAFRRLKGSGAELVITVDCGAAAIPALATAAEIGLPVVVVDHHLMRPGQVPDCLALVNPNRPDCNSGQGNLAAAGVVFVLLAALNRRARARGLFSDERPEPNLMAWLDLAVLGAICDVTELTGFNRALAKQGLSILSRWSNPGLAALMAAAGAKAEQADAYHVGFVLGPRLNAGGRIGRSDLGARLLSTDDPREAAELAAGLDALNARRREVEREVTDQAIAQVEARGDAEARAVIVVASPGWHPGVIGIVAGRLKERWRKPVIVIGIDEATGIGKGSGRSMPGINLGQAVQAAEAEGLLLAGGGHAMACGLTLRADVVPALAEFLDGAVQGGGPSQHLLEIDALISAASADRALYDAFQALAPFGPGNPEPLFALSGVSLRDIRPLASGHVACRLADADGRAIRAIAWRCQDTPLGRRLLAADGLLNVVGRLKADDWNGRRGVQFEIEDMAPFVAASAVDRGASRGLHPAA